ncbi:hypothetical protein ACFL0E_01100 [Nanoarchaeota archaeon]
MVSFKELKSRVRNHFRFSKQELTGLLVAVLATGFIFSFRNWGGDQFNLFSGLMNFLFTIIATAIAFFIPIAFQKIYALSTGYKAEFRTWWIGILIALVLCFVSVGYLTVVLIGGMSSSFMTRHRLGKMRYGTSIEEQGMIGFWSPLGSIISAGLFGIFHHLWPKILFFENGMMVSLVFAICSILPIPRLEGLVIFFGSRGTYLMTILMVLAVALLLILGGLWGTIIGIVIGLSIGSYFMLIGSEV